MLTITQSLSQWVTLITSKASCDAKKKLEPLDEMAVLIQIHVLQNRLYKLKHILPYWQLHNSCQIYCFQGFLPMRTFCMRRAKWYMISLLAMGVPIIDGASLRQFCTVGLNISSKVFPDLRLRHFVDQKSRRFYTLILHCRWLLEHDTWHLVWVFRRDICH